MVIKSIIERTHVHLQTAKWILTQHTCRLMQNQQYRWRTKSMMTKINHRGARVHLQDTIVDLTHQNRRGALFL